jgi:hypothetical protein
MGISKAKKVVLIVASVVVVLGVAAALLAVFLPGALRSQNKPRTFSYLEYGFFLRMEMLRFFAPFATFQFPAPKTDFFAGREG